MANAPFFVDNEVITLDRNGLWIADGQEITHEPTRRLFSRSLVRGEGGWLIKVGRESKKIQVEDTAYFVTGIDGTPAKGFTVRLSDESTEHLDPATLTYRPGRLVCRVKDAAEEAKFVSPAYFDLLRHLEEDAAAYFLVIEKRRVELAPRGKTAAKPGGKSRAAPAAKTKGRRR